MKAQKTFTLIFLIIVLLYIGFDLGPLFFQKESIKDISFSDFRNSIGVALSGTGVYLSYRSAIKKENKLKKQENLQV
ncbi:hypothetical protein HNP37_001313 [Flavobacterium nitrogenifigens]|uniref:Uncharacterized protein n=2 Tax=Flavobacterium TaxID=237 RepID=A0A7W7N799_9FLAO|nr:MULTISPECIES: hypothetical protein [Flavobacterium]MBB4801274.1 hypothetical protein [Flavobacterium nitrogenifigens]MBB6384978.1 hypothetical protein [Flavobacterium notoginsengisoli]